MLFINASELAQEYLTFDTTNNTRVDLTYIQVSESKKATWGDDLIPSDIFLNGDTFEVSLSLTNQTECLHDFKVTDSEGTYAYLTGADLCSIGKITLSYDANGGLTWYVE